MSVLDSFRLDGKVVIVTGASSGLGVSFAQAFAEAGADLVLGARRVEKMTTTAALVEAAGNAEMARVHREVTERIRVIRRLDFTQPSRITATYEEHGKILRAIQRKRGDQAALLLRAHIEASQAEVRKITLHQVHLARQLGVPP